MPEKKKLPRPYADPAAFGPMRERGLARFPERAANWKRKNENPRGEVLEHLPVSMDYEVTSRCNFRCLMCRVNDFPGGKRAEDMTLDDFTRSLDEQTGLVEVKLQGLGEPLLSKDIFAMIALAESRDIWTRLTVNGSLLHLNDNYMRLIDANPGEVQLSFDGATAEVFEHVRKGSNFERVTANFKLANDYAARQGVLKTRAWTVVQKANAHELEDIVRMSADLGFVRLTFSAAVANWGVESWSKRLGELQADEPFTLERAEALMELGRGLGVEVTFWDVSDKFSFDSPATLCSWPFERAYMGSDMRVVPCCALGVPEVCDMGDGRDFMNVWNSETYRRLRRQHLTRRIPGFCRQCYGLDEGE